MDSIISVGVSSVPSHGEQIVAVSMAVPLAELADPRAWAVRMEAVRLALLADSAVIAERVAK